MTEDLSQFIEKANTFIRTCYSEIGKCQEEIDTRITEVEESIQKTGTYSLTFEELKYGARIAWRNNSKCIGRLFWKSLEVFDERELDTEEDIAEALFRHIAYATNNGRIRPTLTVFAPKLGKSSVRIWNHQLLRYAGYKTENKVIGDPASVAFTKQCIKLGWQGSGGSFDILPIVVQIDGGEPKWFNIPQEYILEVPISHPTIEDFKDIGLKWYAVPIISDMLLEIGGIQYIAAPFNGWYMETEIGARNLADAKRYDQLPIVAKLLELDTSTNLSLWKDKALVELNIAVLHSFRAQKVSIVDHHTAAEQFMLFEQQELKCGREVNGNWSWLIPPVSPSTTHIWHKSYKDIDLTPNYLLQSAPYKSDTTKLVEESECPFHQKKVEMSNV
jgi:nitric-oxide synthase, bacterial